ncbi:MAG: tail fiber domain-containing protein [Saprospiraceae bacterium]|nr:tail fiber domain-containing protein [Saprospiraceae bacterium]
MIVCLGLANTASAQVPPSFMIQGLAQDADGNALINQDVEVSVTLDGVALQHEPFVTTSSAGVFRVEVTADDLAGMLLTGTGFLDVTVNGIPLSTPLLSVPYAIIADQVVNDQVEDDDADPTNELQTLSFEDGKLIISDGNEISIPTGNTDADADPTNELQTLTKEGNMIVLSDGGEVVDEVEDDDSDPTNEFQTLSFNNGMLSITDGNSIAIPTGGTDADADPTNELQALRLNGNILEIVPAEDGDISVTLPDGGGGGTSPWQFSGQDIYYNGGDVGIGTSNPSDPLHVDGNARVVGDLSVRSGNNNRVVLDGGSSGGEVAVYDKDNRKVGFMRAADENNWNDPQGDFGYLELLGPNGNSNVILGFVGNPTEQDRGGIGLYNEANNNSWWMSPGPSNDADFRLYYQSGNSFQQVGEFSRTNGMYSAMSDARVKENFTPLSNVLLGIKGLKAFNYNYIFDKEKRAEIGFTAQNVKEEFPALVNEMENGFMGVNYSGLSVVAIKAIQEQQDTIEKQQKLIEQLLERVEKLEKDAGN